MRAATAEIAPFVAHFLRHFSLLQLTAGRLRRRPDHHLSIPVGKL